MPDWPGSFFIIKRAVRYALRLEATPEATLSVSENAGNYIVIVRFPKDKLDIILKAGGYDSEDSD